jgi:hypothetical protein
MLRLLGLLSLSNLLFGGRHHRRMLRRGLFFGAILGYLAHKDFDMDQVEEDARNAARTVKRTVHEAAKAAKRELRDARKAEHFNKVHADIEARKAEHDRRMAERMDAIHAEAEARRAAREARKAEHEMRKAETSHKIHALPECDTREAKAIRELAEDLERDARTAAMAADVPTIQFPEDDEKYYSARKYGYV